MCSDMVEKCHRISLQRIGPVSVCDSDAHDLLESDLVSSMLMLTLDSVWSAHMLSDFVVVVCIIFPTDL